MKAKFKLAKMSIGSVRERVRWRRDLKEVGNNKKNNRRD